MGTKLIRCLKLSLALALLYQSLNLAIASTVQIQTVLGNFEVALFDESTPISVADFLSLVEEHRYQNSIIHRVEPQFILQGGGFYLEEDTLRRILFIDELDSEVMFSNIRGTIAFASAAGATSNVGNTQWFINLADNSEILDHQTGGYTVFGQVINGGMAVVDEIARLTTLGFETFPNLPLRGYDAEDAAEGIAIGRDNYVIVHKIILLDENIGSREPSLPPTITRPMATRTPSHNNDSNRLEGIGSLAMMELLLLMMLAMPVLAKYIRVSTHNCSSTFEN